MIEGVTNIRCIVSGKVGGMKSLLLFLLLCFFTLQSVLAQTAERNYIMRQSVLDEQGTYAVTQVEYYDAAGQKPYT